MKPFLCKLGFHDWRILAHLGWSGGPLTEVKAERVPGAWCAKCPEKVPDK